MKSKYYTPSLEEFHVGFEFEYFDEDDKDWNETTIKNQSDLCNWTGLNIEKRVKFLDKQDIESLGFKSIKLPYQWHTDKHYIWKSYKDNTYGIRDKQEDVIFFGTIKNKSELKKLLIQLNIE